MWYVQCINKQYIYIYILRLPDYVFITFTSLLSSGYIIYAFVIVG